ncbi:MAG TPA: hypothetical protein VMF09_07510 [Solirubrobacteraceae bacterium]|nr:hypothetical protein [Solirubrobacteraceae bacterium]
MPVFTDTSAPRKLTPEQALRRGLKGAFCEQCGFEPANRSQAIAHAARCGSIVAPRRRMSFDTALGEGRR